jgi:hypothetical protein
VTRWVRDQMDFGAEMPELMRRDLHADVSEHRVRLLGEPMKCAIVEDDRAPAGFRHDEVAALTSSYKKVRPTADNWESSAIE